MTREEAITYLKVIWNRYKAEYEIERETLDAYHMAIEALSAPQTDLISRADAIEAVVAWTVEDRPHEVMPTDLVDRIKALPSADAEQGVGRYENAMQKLREMPRYLNGVKEKQITKISADTVCKAHEEEHLNIINRIKELQYAILGEKHQRSHGRLIDADELKKHLDNAWEELNDDGERKGVRLARWYLISAPTVDSTIDVVRCKDCRHHGMRDCPVWGDDTTEDYMWCYYGERREECAD